MQKAPLFTLVLAAALFGLSIYTVYQQYSTNAKITALEEKVAACSPAAPATPATSEEEEHEYPLGEKMGKMLYFTHKAGLAGKYQNWELAAFYAHELEETAESIIEAKVVDEGVEVSKLVASVKDHIENLEKAAKEQNAVEFPKAYETLLRNCNNCHVSTGKQYIVITPLQKDIEGQQFKK
jgi:hypothetical protein